MNITEKNQTQRYREQTSGHQWGEGKEGQNNDGGLRDKTTMYKISYKDILYYMGNIASII